MKNILILAIILVSSLNFAQDILDDQREPIVVETKADLQSELELLPIKYQRDVKVDSLIKFNYAYHGRPLQGDFILFPQKKLTNFLNISSGNKDLFELTNYLSLKNYRHIFDYLYRNDKGDRKAFISSFDNNYTINNHKIYLTANYLKSKKVTNTIDIENKTQNLAIAYEFENTKSELVRRFLIKGQIEDSKNFSSSDSFINFESQADIKPMENIYANLSILNNHKYAHTAIGIYYENFASFGLWSGINEDKIILAPILNLYLNKNNLSLKLTNKPYIKNDTYADIYSKHLYGHYSNTITDNFVPGNANIEVSYFKFLTWSLGNHYLYAVDSPIYRGNQTGQGIYYDSYWYCSYYGKISYQNKAFTLSSKAEYIDYHNFDSDYLPFTPEFRISNSISYQFTDLLLAVDYRFEKGLHNDFNIEVDNCHILDLQANYKFNNWLSIWSELTNLLNQDNTSYLDDDINDTEFKAGIKLFF